MSQKLFDIQSNLCPQDPEMIALDESRNERSFHGDNIEDSSNTKANLDDGTSVNPDISNGLFGEQTDVNTDIEETNLEIEENEVPDGGWGWFIVLGCFVIKMICGEQLLILC